MSQRIHHRRAGITMIGLLVVLAIIAFLLAFLLPAVSQVRNAAGRTQTLNNLKQVGLALHNFAGSYNRMPPAYGQLAPKFAEASIHVYLLPFVEHDKLYNAYMKTDGGEKSRKGIVAAFMSPQDPSFKEKSEGVQNYAANLRAFSIAGVKTEYTKNIEPPKEKPFYGATKFATFTDGTSNVIIFATKYAVCGEGGSQYAADPMSKFAPFFGMNAATEKASPDSAKATFQLAPKGKECSCSPPMAQSFTKDGIVIGLGDASTRFLRSSISDETWNRALCLNDGNVLGDDWKD